jgi:regulator of protease activity HflC (stomatin/prohibitin superfamily)
VAAAIALLSVTAGLAACTTVKPGQVGVKTWWGRINKEEEVKEEGKYRIGPGTGYIIVDISTKNYDVVYDSYSEDKQLVSLDIAVVYSLSKDKVIEILRTYGSDYVDENGNKVGPRTKLESIIRNEVSTAVKSILGKMTGDEILKNRDSVTTQISDEVKNRLKDYPIIIHSIALNDIAFSDAYEAAIEAKMAAEQEVLRATTEAQRKLIEAQGDANAKKVRAQGEADALKIKYFEIAELLGFEIIEVPVEMEDGSTYLKREIDRSLYTAEQLAPFDYLLNYIQLLEKWDGSGILVFPEGISSGEIDFEP